MFFRLEDSIHVLILNYKCNMWLPEVLKNICFMHLLVPPTHVVFTSDSSCGVALISLPVPMG